MCRLPVHYFSKSNAWMNVDIFVRWFHKLIVLFVKKYCNEVGIEYKIVLIIDNAPPHPILEKFKSKDGKVTTMFLPANTYYSLWIKAFLKFKKKVIKTSFAAFDYRE